MKLVIIYKYSSDRLQIQQGVLTVDRVKIRASSVGEIFYEKILSPHNECRFFRGKVQSVFSSVVNIQLADELFTIGFPKVGNGPTNILLTEFSQPFTHYHLAAGDMVTVEGETIFLKANLTIQLAEASVWKSEWHGKELNEVLHSPLWNLLQEMKTLVLQEGNPNGIFSTVFPQTGRRTVAKIGEVCSVDSVECVDGAESIDSVECVDGAESIDGVECVDGAESIDSVECVDGADGIDSVKGLECANNINSVGVTDSADLCWQEVLLPSLHHMRTAFSTSPTQFWQSAKALVGLGPGLTPAGDDFLQGLLLTVRCLESAGYDWAKMPADPDDSFVHWIREKTNLISGTGLTLAYRGKPPEVIKNVLESLLFGNAPNLFLNILRLIDCGSTSGSDILAGIIFACELLQGLALREVGSDEKGDYRT